MAFNNVLLKVNLKILNLPVLESVEPSRDTLDPPLSILVWVKDKLNGRLHVELLL